LERAEIYLRITGQSPPFLKGKENDTRKIEGAAKSDTLVLVEAKITQNE